MNMRGTIRMSRLTRKLTASGMWSSSASAGSRSTGASARGSENWRSTFMECFSWRWFAGISNCCFQTEPNEPLITRIALIIQEGEISYQCYPCDQWSILFCCSLPGSHRQIIQLPDIQLAPGLVAEAHVDIAASRGAD